MRVLDVERKDPPNCPCCRTYVRKGVDESFPSPI